MKSLLLTLALLFPCSIAQAETIELGSESCNQSNICYNTPNNMQMPISYITFNAVQLEISFGGVIYGAAGIAPSITMVPGPNNTMISTYVFDNVTLIEDYGGIPGSTVTLSIVAIVVGYPCKRVGRGIVCQTISTLVDGTLVTP